MPDEAPVPPNNKYIALITLDSKGLIDERHEFYSTLLEYAQYITELHIVVFLSKKYNLTQEQKIVGVGNIWIYYVEPATSIFNFFNWRYIRNLLYKNLVWQGTFRPDFVLSFSTDRAGQMAAKIAKSYNRPFFLENACDFVHSSGLSSAYRKEAAVVLEANKVIVPVNEVQTRLEKKIGVHTDAISVVPPYIALDFIDKDLSSFEYVRKYPVYNIFCAVYLSENNADGVHMLIDTVKTISLKYPRVATILFTPLENKKKFERIIKREGIASNLIVLEEPPSLIPYYRGAHIVLTLPNSDSVDLDLVHSLKTHAPVVTLKTAFSMSLFEGSPYALYLCSDVKECSEKMLYLIEHPMVRDEYKINGHFLVENRFPQTPQSHIEEVLKQILPSIKK